MQNSAAESFELIHEIEIDASPELVFQFFTDAELLERWHGVRADIEPRPGGRFVLNITGQTVTRGTFLELEPGRRLVFTWCFEQAQPPLPTTVEVTFTPVGRGTRVRLRHFGFATAQARDNHRRGWAHYLPRLALAASGTDPGPDAWRRDDPPGSDRPPVGRPGERCSTHRAEATRKGQRQ